MFRFISPYENYTLITRFEREEIISRVRNLIQLSKVGYYTLGKERHCYQGEVGQTRFLITQKKRTHILLPDIRANIEKLKKGSMVTISIELNSFSKISLIAISLAMTAFCGLAVNAAVQQGNLGLRFGAPLIVLLLFYTLLIAGYRLNIYRQKKFLNKFLETESRLASRKTFN